VAHFPRIAKILAALFLLQAHIAAAAAQEPAFKAAEKPGEKNAAGAAKSELPFQIQLLETHIRFEQNGDSRKEVHTVVKLNNIVGAREFARLAFDYNRAFQQLEIPVVRITHANGGTSELLPSAISDAPNPAVEKFPAYQDVRVKSMRILGLQEGDTVEYRVITATTRHPLAPNFWVEHSFDRAGQVLNEIYGLDLPAAREVRIFISPSTPAAKKDQVGEGDSARVRYNWNLSASGSKGASSATERSEPDVVLTTYSSWEQFATHLGERLIPNQEVVNKLYPKAKEIVHGQAPSSKWIALLYAFVSQKIRTIDLPLGATGFRTRPPAEILSSGYATPEDKFALFAALVKNCCRVHAGLVYTAETLALAGLPRPNLFDHLLTRSGYSSAGLWMDLNLEVAPFGMIPSQFRGKPALLVEPGLHELWPQIPKEPAVRGSQRVAVDASLTAQGQLTAKVKYTMRGDNELLLRVAFHETPKDKWKEVASLLAISDGFRGQLASVNVSDPMATKEPFTVEYELSQPKFVDWSKKPVRIPALLPQIGLPEAPLNSAAGGEAPNIALGTPLDVETQLTLHLPPGTKVQAPAGTSVARDYATYVSKYSSAADALTASRKIRFLLREVSAERSIDYSAFLHAVQNDQAQFFILDRGNGMKNAGTK
jgi:Domain of Unknown Function with PDB structure (DUF3857)